MKKKAILFSAIGLVVLIIAGFVFWTHRNGGDTQKQAQAQEDLQVTLEAILGRSDSQGYVYGVQGQFNRLFNDNETSAKINDTITYEIRNVKVIEEKGTAQIFIIAPDVYAILTELASEGSSGENSDALLSQINLALDSNHKNFETNVDVHLEQIGEHWFLVPNEDLANALSGNLIQWYSNLGNKAIDDLIGGISDE